MALKSFIPAVIILMIIGYLFEVDVFFDYKLYIIPFFALFIGCIVISKRKILF